jgi:hypothetical protein
MFVGGAFAEGGMGNEHVRRAAGSIEAGNRSLQGWDVVTINLLSVPPEGADFTISGILRCPRFTRYQGEHQP